MADHDGARPAPIATAPESQRPLRTPVHGPRRTSTSGPVKSLMDYSVAAVGDNIGIYLELVQHYVPYEIKEEIWRYLRENDLLTEECIPALTDPGRTTSLDFVGCGASVTDNVIQQCVQQCPDLDSLYLDSLALTDASMEEVMKNTSMKRLSIRSNVSISQGAIEKLVSVCNLSRYDGLLFRRRNCRSPAARARPSKRFRARMCTLQTPYLQRGGAGRPTNAPFRCFPKPFLPTACNVVYRCLLVAAPPLLFLVFTLCPSSLRPRVLHPPQG